MTTMHNRERMRAAAGHDRLRDTARHQELLDQVAASEYERREVRRILGAPLTEAELDAHVDWKAAPPAPANEPVAPAPRSQACELPDPVRERPHRRDFWRVALLVVGTWAALGLTPLALVKP